MRYPTRFAASIRMYWYPVRKLAYVVPLPPTMLSIVVLPESAPSFTVEQLEAMLAEARRCEKGAENVA